MREFRLQFFTECALNSLWVDRCTFFKCGVVYRVLVIRQYSVCVLHIADQCLTHSSPQSENREGDEEGRSVQSKNLTQTLLGIYDVIVSHKGTSVDFINRDVSQKAPCDYQHSWSLFLSFVFFRVIWTNPRRSSAEPVLQKEVCVCVCAFPLTSVVCSVALLLVFSQSPDD